MEGLCPILAPEELVLVGSSLAWGQKDGLLMELEAQASVATLVLG